MRAREDEFGLRLAAKAADRETAAEQQRPAFEKRLRQLGYSPRAIAHAYRTLAGPGTVSEAFAALKRASRPRSTASPLSFQVVETTDAAAGSDRVTVTSVERGDSGIRVSYELAAQLSVGALRARAEARDDLGNTYRNLGHHLGFSAGQQSSGVAARLCGGFTMPVPPLEAGILRVWITWDFPRSPIRDRPTCEICISLPDQPDSGP